MTLESLAAARFRRTVMTDTIQFSYPWWYQGVHVTNIEGTAWIATHSPWEEDDWYFDRIVFDSVGGEHVVDVIGADRKAVERFLTGHRGYMDDITELVRDINAGKYRSDRALAVASR